MKRLLLLCAATAATVFAAACSDSTSGSPDLSSAPSGGSELAPGTAPGSAAMPHLFHARGWVKNQARRGGGTALLTFHGGPVMTGTSYARAVFWGSGWNNASAVGDKISGIDALYGGYANTPYAGTNTEYTNSSGTHVGTGLTYAGHYVDPNSEPPTRNIQTSAILAEVCKMIPASELKTNGYYPVYTTTPRGNAGYCAWHSVGSCGGTQVQFAFFFWLDGDPGCDPQDPNSTHSQGLEALANVSGHELSEAVTDPHLDAWYDNSGAENADKCAWTFSNQLVKLGSNSWKIQGNFSNAAYQAKSGYDRAGCIDGN